MQRVTLISRFGKTQNLELILACIYVAFHLLSCSNPSSKKATPVQDSTSAASAQESTKATSAQESTTASVQDATQETSTHDSTRQPQRTDNMSSGLLRAPGRRVQLILRKKTIKDFYEDPDLDSIAFRPHVQGNTNRKLHTCAYNTTHAPTGVCVITGENNDHYSLRPPQPADTTYFIRREELDLLFPLRGNDRDFRKLKLKPTTVRITASEINKKKLNITPGDYETYEIHNEDDTDTKMYLFPSPPYRIDKK